MIRSGWTWWRGSSSTLGTSCLFRWRRATSQSSPTPTRHHISSSSTTALQVPHQYIQHETDQSLCNMYVPVWKCLIDGWQRSWWGNACTRPPCVCTYRFTMKSSVADPYWFQCGSGSWFLPQCVSGSGERNYCGFGSWSDFAAAKSWILTWKIRMYKSHFERLEITSVC